uniref:K Homology domain-containing protein n=1 Tax=Acrobeloides nanus TaxID=290746 RepID=A0A914CZ15_9BILA
MVTMLTIFYFAIFSHAKTLISNLVASASASEEQQQSSLKENKFQPTGRNFDIVTVELLIPKKNLGTVVGKGGENIHKLEHHLEVKLKLIQESTKAIGPKPLRITGPAQKVAYARRFMEENYCQECVQSGTVSSTTEHQITAEVIVPGSSVGLIIGKGGENITWLRQETGAKVHFNDNDKDAKERTVTVQGTGAEVQYATVLINSLIKSSVDGMNFYMKVPEDKVGAILGHGGSIIKQITQESGSSIQLMDQQGGDSIERVFCIHGSPSDVQYAQRLIKDRIENSASSFLHPQVFPKTISNEPTIVHMLVPSNKVATVIGKGGQTIQQIEYESGAKISQVHSAIDSIERTLEIRGTPSQIQHAQHLIKDQIGEFGKSKGLSVGTKPYQKDEHNLSYSIAEVSQLHNQQATTIHYNSYASTSAHVSDLPLVTSCLPDMQTGYATQWIKYYRGMGMNAEADSLEQKLKEKLGQSDNKNLST